MTTFIQRLWSVKKMIKDFHCCHCYHDWKQHSEEIVKCPVCGNHREAIICPGEGDDHDNNN